MEPVTRETQAAMIEQDIQSPDSKVSEENIEEILRNHVMAAMGIGLVPVPLIDFVAVSSVQLNLVRRLAASYDIPCSLSRSAYHSL